MIFLGKYRIFGQNVKILKMFNFCQILIKLGRNNVYNAIKLFLVEFCLGNWKIGHIGILWVLEIVVRLRVDKKTNTNRTILLNTETSC